MPFMPLEDDISLDELAIHQNLQDNPNTKA